VEDLLFTFVRMVRGLGGKGTYFDDTATVTGEDEFALAPFVANAFVYGDGGDAFGVVFAVAYVFVEKDGAIEGRDDQPVAAREYNVASDAVDSGALDGCGVAFVAWAEVELADEFAAVEVPEEYASV
jgi:hypothetical protein